MSFCVFSGDLYVLKTGEKGALRLDFQHELSKSGSLKNIKKAGLSKGHIVCDVGCGNGAMTAELAKIVGPTGRVYAIDISLDQLKMAKKKCREKGLDNVIFIQSDMKAGLDIEKADFVYSRFFLMHLDDPLSVILRMKDLLKNGGVILSQEGVAQKCDQIEAQGHFDAVHQLFEKRSLQYDIESKMAQLYEDANFQEVEELFDADILSLENMKKLEKMNLEELCDKVVEENLATPQDCDIWQSGIDSITQENLKPCFLESKYLYIKAKKLVE